MCDSLTVLASDSYIVSSMALWTKLTNVLGYIFFSFPTIGSGVQILTIPINLNLAKLMTHFRGSGNVNWTGLIETTKDNDVDVLLLCTFCIGNKIYYDDINVI